MITKPFERVSPASVGICSQDVLQLLERLSLLPEGKRDRHEAGDQSLLYRGAQ